MVHRAHITKYEKGKYIYKQGDIGDCMYIILKGSVNIIQRRYSEEDEKERDFVLRQLSDGEGFGAM